MKVQIKDRDALSSLTTSNLRSYLLSRGWADNGFWGERAIIYGKEYAGRDWEILIPLRDTVADYAEVMAEAVAVLATVEERSQLDVFHDLAGKGADTVAAAPLIGSGKEGDNMTTPKLARLERVDLREEWKTEAQDFTPWLAQAENLAVLSETLNMELETAGQETSVGLFRADILCRDTLDDSWVLIENQLERTDHTHLGQLLTYAAGLQTVTIIWVAATFTDEHRAALDWLNEITDERFRFFGLEVELWRIGNSPAAPKFNVVSRPNNWSRTTQRVASGEIPESSLKQQRFWEQLSQQLEKSAGNVRLANPPTLPWTYYGLGRTGFHLEAVLNPQAGRIRVELRLKGPDSKAHFALLEGMKEAIETEIGAPLDWAKQPSNNVSRIILHRDGDPADESAWPELAEWTAETLEKFDATFRERVKNINAADWQPDDEMQEE